MAQVVGTVLVFSVSLCMACTRTPEHQPVPTPLRPVTIAAAPVLPIPVPVHVAEPPKPAEPEPPLAIQSALLRGGTLRSPMPGGWIGGWYGDTGVDIAGRYLDVFAVADGTLDYAEWGHTRWTTGKDTAFSVRIRLDNPIPWGNQTITHVYYTHLSKVEHEQAEGAKERRHVRAGERIAVSGIGNGTPHLHLGFLLDNEVEQDSWTYILREDAIRKVMGGYKNGERLP